jgi:hypothetical protein
LSLRVERIAPRHEESNLVGGHRQPDRPRLDLAAPPALRASDARAVVLTGQGHIFSAGVDLLQVSAGGADYLRRFLPSCRAFATNVSRKASTAMLPNVCSAARL